MKTHYIIYSQDGIVKKAVLDENLYTQYKNRTDVMDIFEYSSNTLLEKAYAEKIGHPSGKQQLLD